MNKINPIFGGKIYGLGIYGQFRKSDRLNEIGIESGEIIIKFLDSSGFFLHSFHSSTLEGFPVSELTFDFIRRSPNKLTINILKDISEYGFQLFFDDIIEIYVGSTKTPYWSGTLSELPQEAPDNQIFKFTFTGLKKRLEYSLINRTSTANINITSLIEDLVQNEISDQIKQLNYNSSKIMTIATELNGYKYDNKKGSDVFKTLEKIVSNAEWGVDANREFFFLEKNEDIDNRFIFLAGINCSSMDINKGDFGKIINKMIINKKAGTTGSEYALTVNQETSQSLYGVRAKKYTLPETTSTTDANLWGAGQINALAFPKTKASIKNINFWDFIEANKNNIRVDVAASGRLFSAEKFYFNLISSMENISTWTSTSPTTLVLSEETNIIKHREKSLKVVGDTSVLDEMFFEGLTEQIDMSSTKEISFWIRSNRSGVYLQFGVGESSITENLTDIFIKNPNNWEKICINIENIATKDNINYIGFKCINADTGFELYIDYVQQYWNGRKQYELELIKSSVKLTPSSSILNLDFGSIDWLFMQDFVEATREIEALKEANNG